VKDQVETVQLRSATCQQENFWQNVRVTYIRTNSMGVLDIYLCRTVTPATSFVIQLATKKSNLRKMSRLTKH